ncbi:hypothetical protein ACFL0H_07925 [Thermodesulfobacteriota bacterium]
MIHREPFPIKKTNLLLLIIGLGLIMAYIAFIALISISVGLNHLQQDGFWVPVTAGVIAIIGCVLIFFCFSKFIINRMKEKDIINSI